VSNRTIVEINHDYAGMIKGHEMDLAKMLVQALGSGEAQDWEPLRIYGIRFGIMAHHSSVRYCGHGDGNHTIYREVAFP
jgi:hypothetical protein